MKILSRLTVIIRNSTTCRPFRLMKITRLIMPFAFILYLAGVALLCFMHGDQLPDITGTWFGIPKDKVGHIAMFLPFMPLSYFTFRRRKGSALINLLILSVLLVLGAGTAYMTEIIQEKLSYRTYDAMDLYADFAGLAAGFSIIVAWLLFKLLRNSLR